MYSKPTFKVNAAEDAEYTADSAALDESKAENIVDRIAGFILKLKNRMKT